MSNTVVDFAGKVAIVTGGVSGIGKEVVDQLLAGGAQVVVGDLKKPEGVTAPNVTYCEVDVTQPSGAQTLADSAVANYGRIDILVNDVGYFPAREGFLGARPEDWHSVFDINFFSVVECSRAVIPVMRAAGGGAIVSIGSDLAVQPDPALVDYCAAKAAVVSLSKTLALEFGKDGIRSNVVSPGPTLTGAWLGPGGFAHGLAADWNMTVDEALEHYAKEFRKLPLGRLLQPTEVARVIVFLASDQAAGVTGAEWCVDVGVRRSI
jgi:NAD(P)-dependent dehydrogenase (short-subunit alcohol dehydrogenase family)